MQPEMEQDDIEIEIEDPESVEISMGDLEIDLEPGKEQDDEFNDNLAEHIDDDVLATLAGDLLSDIDDDISARKDWMQTLRPSLVVECLIAPLSLCDIGTLRAR